MNTSGEWGIMGNYINTLVSWVPSKYHKSCYSQLDKTHFIAVVRKVNYRVSLESLCFFLAKRGLLFILLYFILVLAWLERALLLIACLLACLLTYILVENIICGSCLYKNPGTCIIGLNLKSKNAKWKRRIQNSCPFPLIEVLPHMWIEGKKGWHQDYL